MKDVYLTKSFYGKGHYKLVDDGNHIIAYNGDKLWGVPQGERYIRALLRDVRYLEKRLDFERSKYKFEKELMKEERIMEHFAYERKWEMIAHVIERVYLVKFEDNYFLIIDPLDGYYALYEGSETLEELIATEEDYNKDMIEVFNEEEWNKYIKDNNIKL